MPCAFVRRIAVEEAIQRGRIGRIRVSRQGRAKVITQRT